MHFGEIVDAPTRFSTRPKSRKKIDIPDGKPWTRKKRLQQQELTEEGNEIKALEMEKLRDEVTQAYKQMKRRREHNPFTINL